MRARIGNAKSFNGTYSFIDAGNNPSLFINNSITVSGWVYCNAIDGHIINMGGGWDAPGYSLFWLGTSIRTELQPPKKYVDVNAPSLNSWHFLAFTWEINSKLIQTYIDGTLAAFGSSNDGNGSIYDGPIGIPVQNLNIGYNSDPAAGGGYFFNGIIDEARVQSIARNADWIQTEYSNQGDPSAFFLSISGETSNSTYDFEVCANATGVIYSVPNLGNQTYDWTVTGGTFTGDGTNQISVDWGSSSPGHVSWQF